jgi:hypothetical protein
MFNLRDCSRFRRARSAGFDGCSCKLAELQDAGAWVIPLLDGGPSGLNGGLC